MHLLQKFIQELEGLRTKNIPWQHILFLLNDLAYVWSMPKFHNAKNAVILVIS